MRGLCGDEERFISPSKVGNDQGTVEGNWSWVRDDNLFLTQMLVVDRHSVSEMNPVMLLSTGL